MLLLQNRKVNAGWYLQQPSKHMKFSQLHVYVVPIWGGAHGQFAGFPPPHCSSPGVTLTFTVLMLEMNCPISVLFSWGDGMVLQIQLFFFFFQLKWCEMVFVKA